MIPLFRRLTILFTLLIFTLPLLSQVPALSVSTDLGAQRNFKKEQQFWAFGQTVTFQFHLAPKDAVYFWFAYYSNGKFSNQLTATALAPATLPASIPYKNKGVMRLSSISVGWKKWLKGTFDEEQSWNLYGYAGFGLIFGRITNTHSVLVDTALYRLPVLSGAADFKRLSLDLGMGVEFPVGGDFFLYTEAKAWVPASDYPSKYIFVNSNAPFAGMLTVGIRLLF
jgi:hypothetical protein